MAYAAIPAYILVEISDEAKDQFELMAAIEAHEEMRRIGARPRLMIPVPGTHMDFHFADTLAELESIAESL